MIFSFCKYENLQVLVRQHNLVSKALLYNSKFDSALRTHWGWVWHGLIKEEQWASIPWWQVGPTLGSPLLWDPFERSVEASKEINALKQGALRESYRQIKDSWNTMSLKVCKYRKHNNRKVQCRRWSYQRGCRIRYGTSQNLGSVDFPADGCGRFYGCGRF